MHSVHLITGDDPLLTQRATQRLLADLSSADPDLAVEVYDASELADLPELRTQSLFGGRVCAVIRGAEAPRADLKAELESYLESPDPEAVLVLVASGTSKIQKVARLVKEHGTVISVETPPDWKADAWARIVTDEFARAARTANRDAVQAILEHAGLDPSVIASKVSQVVASTRDTAITIDHVEAVVEGHGRRSGFELADAIADRDAALAITLLRGSLESGEAPLALVGAITYRFRQLQQVRGGVTIRMSPGQRDRLARIAREHFSPGELAWSIDRLAQLDVDLKGNSDLPPDLSLELAVIDLATPRQVGLPWNPMATSA